MGIIREININNWKRKEQFYFFKDYASPFFNITANLDITSLRKKTSEKKQSFFLTSLHKILHTINSIEEFRYRIVDEKLVEYSKINVGSTVLNDDNTFSYVYFEYFDNLDEFILKAQKQIDSSKNKKELVSMKRVNLVYFTSIPWVSYTHISHAHTSDKNDMIPRVAVGKYFEENGKIKLPISMEVHHALCDGFHVGQFFERLENNLKSY